MDDHHELIINRNSEMSWCQPVFDIFPHLDQWRTKDLFQKHPTKPDLWTFKGRRYDIIVLSNGEKVNPVLMESAIQAYPALKGAFVVGAERFQPALVIKPEDHENDNGLILEV
jgi:acyl-coenzyme A synthetase/AMP-(fatty) acid ligase